MAITPPSGAAGCRARAHSAHLHVPILVLLISLCACAQAAAGVPGTGHVSGVVFDPSGAAVPQARVVLLTASDTEVRWTMTDAAGRFRIEGLDTATYVLAVRKAGFGECRRSVVVEDASDVRLEVALGLGTIDESVTVTALRGVAQDLQTSPQVVTVTDAGEIGRRESSVLPRALIGELGVHVQQTSTSQGSPFIRGLTGQQVVTLIDGVRFNNATFRPGANQYTALVDTSVVERVEIVRGPNGAQYGSDSLGGTINLLTNPLGTGRDRFGVDGSLVLTGASADLSTAGSLRLAAGAAGWGLLVDVSGHRAGDLRTGGRVDSHSVATRLLGLPSAVLGDRLQDTAFSQHGVRVKLSSQPRANEAITAQYIRGAQTGASRYDQLDGGVGNLLNRFDPQTLDFVTARYNRVGLPGFETLSASISFNGQRDDREYQNVNNAKQGLRSPISTEHNRTNAFGYQAQATRRFHGSHTFAAGAEYYDEYVESTRLDASYSAATGDFSNTTAVRARYPNGAQYRTLGIYGQDDFPLFSDRLTATVAVRSSWFRYSQSADDNPTGAAGPLVPTYATSVGDLTFNSGLAFALTPDIVFTAGVSRGFRAPNVNDYGSIGVSGLGFEVSPDEGIRLGASVAPLPGSQPAPASQIWTLGPLEPERLLNFEAGLKWRWRRLSGTAAVFDSEIRDLIERRTVILAPGATGQTIGGQAIIRQDASGAVYTSLSSSPVFVRTNAGEVRLTGAEGSLGVRLGSTLALNGNVSWVRGVDLATGLPPGLENGIPPTHGLLALRWEPQGRRYWLEGYSYLSAAQRRFSANDLAQARIGGIRTQQEITNFFNNGAVARGLVNGGVLLATGERLPQVLTRVLGPDPAAVVPFKTYNPAFATVNVRGGIRFSRHAHLTVLVENVFDANYRTMGSGVDGPGLNVVARQVFTF